MLAGGALSLALFPGHVTAAVAGVLFGALAGTALALAAAVLGAALCAVAARRGGADAVHAVLGPRGRHWRSWLADNGFNAVLVSRLAPATPSGVVNYVAGLAGIALRTILLAVALGALPKTIAYVSLGGALSDPLSTRARSPSRCTPPRRPAGCWWPAGSCAHGRRRARLSRSVPDAGAEPVELGVGDDAAPAQVVKLAHLRRRRCGNAARTVCSAQRPPCRSANQAFT